MLIWGLLIIFFWAVLPGLLTGWMLRERGRRFLPGLLLGAVCGPLGILAALAFIYVSDRRRAARRRHVRGSAVRVFYDIPVVGQLHVSTVWALAGIATFLCLWMVGGISYEFYRTELSLSATPEQAKRTAGSVKPSALLETNPGSGRKPTQSSLTAQPQTNTSAQTRSALLGNITTRTRESAPGRAPLDNSPVYSQPEQGAPVTSSQQQQEVAALGPTAPPAAVASPAATPARVPARPRSEAVAELAREFASRGHRVHAALSGDSQTATLSLSGATLTRAAGNQLLGNGRLRGALKAAGVRIVVMVNGEESWTYIL